MAFRDIDLDEALSLAFEAKGRWLTIDFGERPGLGQLFDVVKLPNTGMQLTMRHGTQMIKFRRADGTTLLTITAKKHSFALRAIWNKMRALQADEDIPLTAP